MADKLISAYNFKSTVMNWRDKYRYYHPRSKANTIPMSELFYLLDHEPEIIAEEWLAPFERGAYNRGRIDASADSSLKVFCKDCKHRVELIYEKHEKGNNIMKVCPMIRLQVNDDFYCGFGERKDGEKNDSK